MLKLKLATYLFAAGFTAFAQQQHVQSPDVQSDGRVTFRLQDPNAQSVQVGVSGIKDPIAMQKDASGAWSVTTDVWQPDLYQYTFIADGVHLLDPSNHVIAPNLLNPSNMVNVPGPTPQTWDETDVPHGAIHHHFYTSKVIGDKRDFYVYTPPGYDAEKGTKYPVLYLLHGFSDDASGWTTVGKANFILDSLIASGKAKPMIVVMPLGYGAPEIVDPSRRGAITSDPSLRERNMTLFTQALLQEVIPAIELMYHTKQDRDSRAIAGLSMGGAETLLTGLNHLDKFSWIGSFSAGGVGTDFNASFPNLNEAANKQLHLLWVACGVDDRLITPNRDFITWLKGKNINVTAIETPGMHTWTVWRRNLTAFAPLLFTK